MDPMAQFNKVAIETLRYLTVQKAPEKLRSSFLEAVYCVNKEMVEVGLRVSLGEFVANELRFIASGSVHGGHDSRIQSRIKALADDLSSEGPEEHKEELSRLLNRLLQGSFGRHDWGAEVAVEPKNPSALEVPAETVNHKFGCNFG